jgi:thioredoxin-related protein
MHGAEELNLINGDTTTMRYLTGFLLLLLSGVIQAEPPAGYDFLAYDEGIELARETGKPVFVYGGRIGCGFCERNNKETFSDPAIKKALEDRYVLVYLDTESSDRLTLDTGERISEMQFAQRANLIGTPFFVILSPDGRELTRLYGYQPKSHIVAFNHYVDEERYKRESFYKYMTSLNLE